MFKSTAVLFLTSVIASAQVSVTTHHYDNFRTGANPSEQVLNISNVNRVQFGKLFAYPVDGSVFAQPLYVPDLTLPDGSRHNVLYVVTMNNSVYAFDADSRTGINASPLWSVNYNNPSAGITPVPSIDVQGKYSTDIIGPIGILGTPVIDLQNDAIYFVVRTKEKGAYFQRLHALDIRSGQELTNSPAIISGSVTSPQGTTITFDSLRENQRAALALANGMVYIAWAAHADHTPFHGWVIAYSAYSTIQPRNGLQQRALFVTTNGGTEGGIWQSGSGPIIDSSGDLYYGVGNGSWDGTANFGNSTIKLSPTLQLLDYFTPDDWQYLNTKDLDLGVGGAVLVPGTDLLIQTSKIGLLYVLSTVNLGQEMIDNKQIPQILKSAYAHIHSGLTYWKSPAHGGLLYFWSENDYLRAYHFNGATFDSSPLMFSNFEDAIGMPGGFLAVSSNANVPGTGILWATTPYVGDALHQNVRGVLRAFDADNLSTELWNSHMNTARDDFGSFAKFCPPVVANGKVYVATFSNQVAVYGLLPVAAGIFESLSASNLFVNVNASGSVTAQITSTIGGTAKISIATSGVPTGVTVQVTPSTLNGTGSSTLTFSVTPSAPAGPHQVTVHASSGSYSASQQFMLTVGQNKLAGIQFNAGGTAVGTFSADVDYSGGSTSHSANTIKLGNVTNPAPLAVYQSMRYGPFTYTIPHLIAGQQYTVRLHFAETFFTTIASRLFNIAINGTPVLQDFDAIVAAAGVPNTAIVRQFTVTASTSGQIIIAATTGRANKPMISGIEVQ